MSIKRIAPIFVILILLMSVLSPVVNASVVFGPVKYDRTTGSPNYYHDSFSINGPNGNYTLYVKNGDLICNGSTSPNASVSSVVSLNGRTIFSPDDFKKETRLLRQSVSISSQNELNVDMRGIPSSTINVWLEDETPGIQILAPWDDAVSNGPITLKGMVTDPSIASVTVDLNGALTIVPVSDRNFSTTLNLASVNNITISAVDRTGTLRTASLLLDGDMLTGAEEAALGFDPLNPDSDSSLTADNEAGNGVPDGYEMLGGRLPAFVKARTGADPLKDDTDGDGLTDYFEVMKLGWLTDLTSADSDDDGISDAQEDPDQDGLSNIQEQTYGTDPYRDDTDEDSLTDAYEINVSHTNPLLADTDDDRLLDDSETRLGTDPNDPDTDGDGILDGDETYTTFGSNASLDVSVSLTGKGDLAKDLVIRNETSRAFTGIPALVSPVVDLSLNTSFDNAGITFSYDPASITDPENLSIYYYNRSAGTFQPMVSTVDSVNHTVSCNTGHFSTFVVFHVPTWNALFQAEMNTGRGTTDVMFVDVMFTIDSSGSMSWNDPYGYRKMAAKNFVGALITGDRAGVVDFDSYAYVSRPLTGDFNAVNTSIDRLDANGGTNIGAGVSAANSQLINNGNRSHAWMMILLTDGQGSYSDYYTQQAKANNITIYTVGLGSSVDSGLLTRIATGTGGQYFQVASADQLPQVFRNISEDIEPTDSDEDGLSDTLETTGFRDGRGKWYVTDPNNPDTDGDGLTDGEEAGAISELNGMKYYKVLSDPTLKDYDEDGLWDDEELQIGTNPFYYDTDYDLLSDKNDPEPLTPLYVSVIVSDLTMKRDVIVGALFGDTGDVGGSFHWLVGDMASSPYYLVGAILSGFVVVGDIRDTLQSIVNMDALGTALNAAGFIPIGGDALKVSSTIATFMAKHAGDARYLADIVKVLSVCFLKYMPDYVYMPAYRTLTNDQVDRLLYIGLDWDTIIRLGSEGKNINELAKQSDRLLSLGIESDIIKELITNKNCNLAEIIYAFKRGEFVVWLEKGRDAAGWMHIFNKHIIDYLDINKNQFARLLDLTGTKYRDAESIQSLIYDAVKYGKENPTDLGVYYYKVTPEAGIKVVVGDNGYIVSSNPMKLVDMPITF